MPRPVTLFTGQWADLPLETLCKKAKSFGYDGLELACWGDHFEVDKALDQDDYCAKKRALLEKYGLQVVVGTHPIPENYYQTHQKLGTWTSPRWQELIQHVVTDEETRCAYD